MVSLNFVLSFPITSCAAGRRQYRPWESSTSVQEIQQIWRTTFASKTCRLEAALAADQMSIFRMLSEVRQCRLELTFSTKKAKPTPIVVPRRTPIAILAFLPEGAGILGTMALWITFTVPTS
jgi:hypothetical protein